MGDPCQICGAEPAARLTLLGASDPLTIVACVRHRNALAFDIGQAIGRLLSAETTRPAAPSARAETGAMQFGSDWRGIFIRGDSAFYFAQQLAMVATWLHKQGAYPKLAGATLEGLRNLLLTSHQQRTDVEVQLLRPFAECSDRAAPCPIHYLGSDMRRACYYVESKGPSPDRLIMTRDVAEVTCSECLAIVKLCGQ
jgi:hypothetical protein